MATAVKQVLKEFEGQMRLVVRYMPFHNSSTIAVAAFEAAGRQGKFWEMLNLLFERQDEWGHRLVPDMTPFHRFAAEIGLDANTFSEDILDPKHADKVMRDKNDGNSLGVQGTPTFFINGKKLEDLGLDPLKLAIENELKK